MRGFEVLSVFWGSSLVSVLQGLDVRVLSDFKSHDLIRRHKLIPRHEHCSPIPPFLWPPVVFHHRWVRPHCRRFRSLVLARHTPPVVVQRLFIVPCKSQAIQPASKKSLALQLMHPAITEGALQILQPEMRRAPKGTAFSEWRLCGVAGEQQPLG